MQARAQQRASSAPTPANGRYPGEAAPPFAELARRIRFFRGGPSPATDFSLVQGLPMIESGEHQAQPTCQNTAEVSDCSLLRRVRLGSDDAATQLYLRYAH